MEMVTVVFLVGILLAIVLGTGRNAIFCSRETSARTDLHLVADALDRYYLIFGDYPQSPSNRVPLDAIRGTLENKDATNEKDRFHFERLLPKDFSAIDPWGAPYIYELSWSENAGQTEMTDEPPVYTLRSRGRDGKEGTDDDIEYP